MFVNKTRRKTMTYNKPEVVKLDSALSAIQGTGKPQHVVQDNLQSGFAQTIGAYEGDE
jgi:hypothetical protein